MQSIRFRLDESGAVLKSESIGVWARGRREFVFDKPFLIMVKRQKARRPYLVLWIGNTELLVPIKKKRAEEPR